MPTASTRRARTAAGTTRATKRRRTTPRTALEHLQRYNRSLTLERASARYEHGTHARYVLVRCRCRPCINANTNYERVRKRNAIDADPWVVDYKGRISRDGFKSLRVVNRLTGKVDSRYIVDTLETASRTSIPARAHRRAAHLNKRDGAPDARAGTMVSVKAVRAHIAWLRENGMGYKTIAKRAGITASVLARIIGHKTGYRTIRKTRRDVVDAIMGVDPKALAGGARVDSAHAKAMIDRLRKNGFTSSFIASLIHGRKVNALQVRLDTSLTMRHYRRITEIYNKLHNVRPKAKITVWGPRPMTRGDGGFNKGGVLSPDQAREIGIVLPTGLFTAPQRRMKPRAVVSIVPKPPTTPREKLRARLASWDTDEFTRALSRMKKAS